MAARQKGETGPDPRAGTGALSFVYGFIPPATSVAESARL